MDRTDPTDLARWFAYGIDAIGRGDWLPIIAKDGRCLRELGQRS